MESTKHPVSANSDNSNANAIVSELELPRHFLRCSRTHLIVLISRMLSSLIQLNDSTVDRTRPLQLTRFHSRVPPPISVYNYLARLAKYSSLEHCVLLASVYYIDLLSSVFPEFRLDSLTVHRFLLTATTVASKGLCDSFCTNTHYAKVGGVQCSELNVLENDFLTKVNYRILPREKNVFQCTVEHQEHIFSYANIPTTRKHMQGEMNTFNVLEEYYHRMVHLIGDFNASPDKSCCISFRLEPERLPVHQIANKEVARQPDAKPLDRGLSQDNEGKHNEPSGEICSTSTSAPVTKETSRADIFTSAGASATEQVVFQGNRKRNYSESSINHSGPCNQVPISKKHSNSQPKHSPREIV